MAQEARNKLRRMGGIMASSPELMQAAQGYQAGGHVDVASAVAARPEVRVMAQRMGMSVPEYLASLSPAARQQLIRNTVGGSDFDAAADAAAYQKFADQYEAETTLPSQEELDLGPRQIAYRARDRRLGIPTVPSSMSAPSAGEAPAVPSAVGPTLAAASRQSPSTRPSMPMTPPPSTELDASDIPFNIGSAIARKRAELEAETDPYVRRSLENQLRILEGMGQAEDFIVEDVIPPAASATAAAGAGADALLRRGVYNPLLTAAGTGIGLVNPRLGGPILNTADDSAEIALMGQEEDVDPIEQLLNEREQLVNEGLAQTSDSEETEVGAEQPPAPEADTEEKTPPRPLDDLQVPEEFLERLQTAFQEDPRLGGGGDGGADTDDDTGDGPPPPPPEPTKKDLRSRYKEKMELFKEIYGEDDEARAQDRMLSLAMMGLAIASGQSPNALTNIAQGAAAGLQGMSEQERARREQEQGLQSLALESAMGDMSAEQQAEARMAEKMFDRNTRLAVAEVGNSGGSNYGSRVDPATAYLRVRGDLSKSTEFMGADSETLDMAAYQQLLNTYGNIPYVAELGRRLGIEQPNPVMSPEEAEAEANKLLE